MTDPKIMVIDDDEYSLRFLLKTLAGHGLSHTTGFTRARHALDQLLGPAEPPDVVLCDLNMPEMDGVEFIEALAETPWHGGLVLITGEGPRLLDAACRLAKQLKLNVLGSISKPAIPASLIALIRAYNGEPCEGAVEPASSHSQYHASELEAAIGHRDMALHYQPIVRLSDGEPASLECLARWRHPTDGLVYPDQFIGLAEESGLIDPLTELVIDMATTQAVNWRQQGLKLPLSINLSMETLQHAGVVERLQAQVEEAGLNASDVVWEVTESRVMTSAKRTLSALSRLRLRKFSLSIDDFGTGHSSLAQLRDLPFEELKIDRSFVHDAWLDDVRAAMVEASVSIAQKLDIASIAEGVENLEDWKFVQEAGCSHAQGWVIARPQPANSIASWLQRWPEEFETLNAATRPSGHRP